SAPRSRARPMRTTARSPRRSWPPLRPAASGGAAAPRSASAGPWTVCAAGTRTASRSADVGEKLPTILRETGQQLLLDPDHLRVRAVGEESLTDRGEVRALADEGLHHRLRPDLGGPAFALAPARPGREHVDLLMGEPSEVC